MITDKLKTAGYYVLLKTTTPFPFPSPVADTLTRAFIRTQKPLTVVMSIQISIIH